MTLKEHQGLKPGEWISRKVTERENGNLSHYEGLLT